MQFICRYKPIFATYSYLKFNFMKVLFIRIFYTIFIYRSLIAPNLLPYQLLIIRIFSGCKNMLFPYHEQVALSIDQSLDKMLAHLEWWLDKVFVHLKKLVSDVFNHVQTGKHSVLANWMKESCIAFSLSEVVLNVNHVKWWSFDGRWVGIAIFVLEHRIIRRSCSGLHFYMHVRQL